MVAASIRKYALAMLAFTPASSMAAGLPAISGVNAEGYTVSVDFDYPPYSVEIWRKGKGATAQRFDNEPCQFSEEVDRKGHTVRSFSCSREAKSPLAGTEYRGREVNGSCERGDPEFRYTCVEGCDRNKRAPKKMTQNHWEC